MSLSDLDVKAIYSGDGTTTDFAITAAVIEDDSGEIEVYVRDESVSPATETLQTEGSQYTLTGRPDVNSQHTTVSFVTAPAATSKVVIRRELDLTQELDATANGEFKLVEHENAYDRFVAMIQQTNEKISRALKFKKTSSQEDVELPEPTANAVLKWDSSGVNVENGPTSAEIENAEANATAAANSATASATSASESSDSADLAEDWATETASDVNSTGEYSAKEYAQGVQAGTGGSAKDWAQETASDIDSSGSYSSKEWASGIQTRGAASGGSSKDWANYVGGTVDDTEFSAKHYANEAAFAALSAYANDAAFVTAKGAAAVQGNAYYNTTSGRIRLYDGSAWADQNLADKEYVNLEEQASTPTTPTAGTKLLYAKNDGKLYSLDDAGNEIEVGSGAGGGEIFYINEDFETGVSNLSTYADAAGTTPVDADGGTANITVTAETVSPLIGSQSAKLTKDAANRQGEGVVITSDTVDEAYENSVHTVELLWKPDATVVADALKLFVVHPTTGTVEALNFRTILGEYTNSLPDDSTRTHRIVSELTPIDSTYKIVIHVAGTDSTAYTGLIDNIQCGPQRTFNAPIVTEWQSYTPNITNGGTTSTNIAQYRRNGSNLEIEIYTEFSGSGSAGNVTYSLPSGLTGSVLSGGNSVQGIARYFDTGVDENVGYTTLTGNVLAVQLDGGTAFLNGSSIASGDRISIKAEIPISGWDAGAAFSTTQVDQQTEALRYTVTSAQTIETAGSGEVVNFNNQVFDELNSVTTGAGWSYTAPTRRKVKVNAKVFLSDASWGAGETAVLYIRKNGANYALVGYYESEATQTVQVVVGGSASIRLDAGDTVDVFLDITRSGNCTIPGAGQQSWVEIEQIPDFSVFGTFPEKNWVETKTLSANVTSDGTISDLTFSDLTIGKMYEVSGNISMELDAGSSDSGVLVNASHDSTTLDSKEFTLQEAADGNTDRISYAVNFKFKASATTLTFVASGASSNSPVTGNGTRSKTYIQVEERNNLRER